MSTITTGLTSNLSDNTITILLRNAGFRWSEIESLSPEDKTQLLFKGKDVPAPEDFESHLDSLMLEAMNDVIRKIDVPAVDILEAKIIERARRMASDPVKYVNVLGILHGMEQSLLMSAEATPTMYHIGVLNHDLLQSAVDYTVAKVAKKNADNKVRAENRLENRAEYGITPILTHSETKDKAGVPIHAWRYEHSIRAHGLASQANWNTVGDQERPVIIPLLNMLPPDKATGQKHKTINPIHWAKFREMDYFVSGERIAWDMNSWSWRLMVGGSLEVDGKKLSAKGAFQNAIDFRAYNHSMGSPLLSGGKLQTELPNGEKKDGVEVQLKCLTGFVHRAEALKANKAEIDGKIVYLHPLEAYLNSITLHDLMRMLNAHNKSKKPIFSVDDAMEIYQSDSGEEIPEMENNDCKDCGVTESSPCEQSDAPEGVVCLDTEENEKLHVKIEYLSGSWSSLPLSEKVSRLHDVGLAYIMQPYLTLLERKQVAMKLQQRENLMKEESALECSSTSTNFSFSKKPWWSKALKEIRIKDDGSGRYHPEHPSMKKLVEKHGAVTFQFRAINEAGIFLKGILVPDTRCVSSEEKNAAGEIIKEAGKPEIWCSLLQVKGRHKAVCKTKYKAGENGKPQFVHMGIMRSWSKRRTMAHCFEGLENMQDNAESQLIVKQMLDEYFKEINKGGLDQLLAEVSRDDEVIGLIVKLIALAKQQGLAIDPMKISRVAGSIKKKLGKKLWTGAQGAGINGRQHVIVLDATLQPGTCYSPHFKTWSNIATWRLPMILPQGLLTLKVVPPSDHHLLTYGEKVRQPIPEVMFMSPKDVAAIQGDDDGDIVAATADPRVYRLHQLRMDNEHYAIEPDGVSFTFAPDTEDGRAYIAQSPMGPVGVYTIARSKLLAAGDKWGALALAVAIQEAIDKAKRRVRWSNPDAASIISNWRQIDGVWHLHWIQMKDGTYEPMSGRDPNKVAGAVSCSMNFMDEREDFPGAENADSWVYEYIAQKFVNKRLRSFGVPYGAYTLGWRRKMTKGTDGELVPLSKSIDPDYWADPTTAQGGWTGGNLVHNSDRSALAEWHSIKKGFEVKSDLSIDQLVPELLRTMGHDYDGEQLLMPWPEYEKIQNACGLGKFSKGYSTAIQISDEDARNRDIATLFEILRQDMASWVQSQPDPIQAQLIIWVNEMKDRWYTTEGESFTPGSAANLNQRNNPNKAFSAVCWPGSPIMAALGLSTDNECDFLDVDKIKKLVSKALESGNAFKAFADMLWKQPAPGKLTPHEISKGVRVYDCPHCIEALFNGLIKEFRAAKFRGERAVIGELISALNINKYKGAGKSYDNLEPHEIEAMRNADTKLLEDWAKIDAEDEYQLAYHELAIDILKERERERA